MEKSMRIVLVVLAVGAAIAAMGGYMVWQWMTGPLYRPGMVRAGKNLRAPLEPPVQSGAAGFWQVEPDVKLHYFESGEGEPVLVVHGGPGYPYIKAWSGLERLAGRYHFYYFDQRGAGESTRLFDRFASRNTWANMQTLDRGLGLGAQIADIERIHSFGGFLAALYAAEFPERVRRLVLISPAELLVMPPENGGLFPLVRERLPKAKRAGFDAFLTEYLDFKGIFDKDEAGLVALNERMGSYYVASYPKPATILERRIAQGRPGGWMTWAAYLGMGQRHDYRAAMRNAALPVQILHGDDDLQSEKASRTYLDIYPQAKFEKIAGASHFAFEEQPEEFARRVGSFLDGRSGAAMNAGVRMSQGDSRGWR
jgi:proline iminopeptidase